VPKHINQGTLPPRSQYVAQKTRQQCQTFTECKYSNQK